MITYAAFALGILAIVTNSAPQLSYDLPAGADSVLTDPVSTDFSCEERPYGYYADTHNNCQLFHICLPIEDEEGDIISTNQWTFLCGNGTMFDQQTLSCNYAEDAFPCEEAELLYGAVMFGLGDDVKKL